MRVGDLVAHELQQLLGCAVVAQPAASRMKAADRLRRHRRRLRPTAAEHRSCPRPAPARRHRVRQNSAASGRSSRRASKFCDARAVSRCCHKSSEPSGTENTVVPTSPVPGPAARHVRKRKIGHHRTGRADLVAIVEVIDARLIEIDRLLHPPQAERVRPERIVLRRALAMAVTWCSPLIWLSIGSSPARPLARAFAIRYGGCRAERNADRDIGPSPFSER